MAKRELNWEKLTNRCDADCLTYKSTQDVKMLKGAFGHERAIRAVNFGLSNKMKGFNIYLLGDSGSGKTSILKNLLKKRARNEPTAPDWVYVYNFDDSNRPQAFQMSPGMGVQFQKDMSAFVNELKRLIPRVQEGDKYLQLGQKIEETSRKKEQRVFNRLKRLGRKNDLHIEQVSGELLIQVIRDGRPLDHEEFEQLTMVERKYYEDKVRDIQDEISDFLRNQRKLDRVKQSQIRKLEHDQILKNTEDLVEDLKRKYGMVQDLNKWFDTMRLQIPDAFRDFQRSQEDVEGLGEGMPAPPQPDFHEFRVNVLVKNKNGTGAPVVFENTPTLHNLLGCVEYQEHFGILFTDYTLIRAGSLHRANGGYLVIQANDLMKSMYAWDALKKALRNKEVTIEELDIEQRTRSTVSPKPMPIPLQTKVILIGNFDFYYYMLHYDEDFSRLFKVKAEFDEYLPRNLTNMKKYAGFIRRLVEEDGLLHFDASAMARIIEYGSRLAEHQRRLSARFINLINIVSEANFWAYESGAKIVSEKHVLRAMRERSYRTGKLEYEMYEQIREGHVLIDVKGEVVGQINGIAVYDIGDHAFGIPSRITAKTYVGQSGILNIDREAKMSGQIHSKASLILVGIIGGLYAQEKPLALSASLCFEQMYGTIEGDSASCAELYALISSLAQVPIRQGVCITGSMNQRGEVQPIGGANEKIEGVFRICKAKGLTGRQGVVIPHQNEVNLVLDDEVVSAVKAGKFHIWTIRSIDDGVEILMNRPAKEVHKLARKRLSELYKAMEAT